MKILIVGAGPTGLSAALNAGKEGNEVFVFEKDSKLGSKICGEALAREALDFVSMKPSKKFINREVQGFRMTFKGKFIREAKFKNSATAPGYLIDKPMFLHLLKQETEKFGVKVYFNAQVEKVDPRSGKIGLRTGEIVQGDLVICADGYGSVARKHLDYTSFDTALSAQIRCSLPEGLDPEYLHLDIIGEGYTWTFVKKESCNVGVGLPANACSREFLSTHLSKQVERLGVEPLSRVVFAPVSMGGPLENFENGKMVVSGEAAGCVMPLSGEGIRFGIYGGSIAHKPKSRTQFMKKYGRNMERSRKMLRLVRNLNDQERTDFLRSLENPLEVLEGQLPRIEDLSTRAKLLAKVIIMASHRSKRVKLN